MSWWSRTLALLFAAGWIALVVAFVWALWSDGVEYIDFGNLELRFDFEGDDGEKVLATVIALAIGLAALMFIVSAVFGFGGRRRYHQMLRQDGTQLLVDTDIVSQRLEEAAKAVPGVRKVSAAVKPASNNEVRASLDLEVYSDADPAVTAQQASQAAIGVLQRDFDTRPSGGLKTQVRQVGKPTPGGRPAPAATYEATAPESTEENEVSATQPVAAEPEPDVTEVEAATAEAEEARPTDVAPGDSSADEPPIHEGEEEESAP